MRTLLLGLALGVSLLFSPAGNDVDLERQKEQLLELHRRDLEAHLASNVDWLAGNTTEDFFSVANGEVHFPAHAEREEMFRGYLGRTTFTEYRDLQPPMVRISRDGTLALMVVQVKAAGAQRRPSGEDTPLEFVSAWAMLYEKSGGEWFRAGVVSTFAPPK